MVLPRMFLSLFPSFSEISKNAHFSICEEICRKHAAEAALCREGPAAQPAALGDVPGPACPWESGSERLQLLDN